jgi:methionine synthase II (cobalamin-independent)
MTKTFNADCTALLIGSLPMDSHAEATRLMFNYVPEIPLWVQLPRHTGEGMIEQFLPGMPGFTSRDNKVFINTDAPDFQDQLVAFYEEYMAVTADFSLLAKSRFSLTPETAQGFFELLSAGPELPAAPKALKGQITGPITMGVGVKDQNGKSIFYDDTLRDVLIKLLAFKARWQAEQLGSHAARAIVFFDEPGFVSFGSSAFISISREQVNAAMAEVIDGVHGAGGLAGIHICANGDFSLALDAGVDIISFDAYNFFDKLMLYSDKVREFIGRGGILAWGIVPTDNPEHIEKESIASLEQKWEEEVAQVQALGFDRKKIMAQSLITPSCGTGSLTLDQAVKVLELTRELSRELRKKM